MNIFKSGDLEFFCEFLYSHSKLTESNIIEGQDEWRLPNTSEMLIIKDFFEKEKIDLNKLTEFNVKLEKPWHFGGTGSYAFFDLITGEIKHGYDDTYNKCQTILVRKLAEIDRALNKLLVNKYKIRFDFTLNLNYTIIDDQKWSKKNFNGRSFRNGDLIEFVTNRTEFELAYRNKLSACCFPNFNPRLAKYGLLYNVYALADHRELAPEGWKIPEKKDWEILIKNCGVGGLVSENFSKYDAACNSFSGFDAIGMKGVSFNDKWGGPGLISDTEWSWWWAIDKLMSINETGQIISQITLLFDEDDQSISIDQQRTLNKYTDDESMWEMRSLRLIKLTESGTAIEHTDHSLKKDKEVVLAAVRQNGYALEYADKSLKKDKDILKAAGKYE